MESVVLKFKCEICSKYFSQNSSRNRHVKEKHLKPNMYHCERCESRFSKKYNLQIHIEKVHSKDSKQIKCCHCNRVFTNSYSFKKHFKGSRECAETNISIAPAFENSNEKDAQSVAESVLKELKQLQLDIQTSNITNSKSFENVQELAKIDSSKVQVITVKDNLYPLGNFKLLKAHTLTRENGLKYYICDFCSKEFRKTYNFLRHRRIHTKLRPFVCVLCKATFPTTAQLKSHCSIHKLHEQFGIFGKLYNCPKCDATFCSIQQFDKHISTLSDCRVSFKCPKCHKQFRALRALLRHEHSEKDNELEMLKPFLPTPLSEDLPISQYNRSSYECSCCGIQVKDRTLFKQHVKRHENLFRNQCAKCQKSFATKPTLKIHTKTHLSVKSFKCHYCNNRFNTLHSCRRHMETHLKRLLQTHEEEKDTISLFPTLVDNGKNEPTVTTTLSIIRHKKAFKQQAKIGTSEILRYKCADCDMSFRYKAWLKKHFKYKHTNEYPFKCDICSREFRTKQSMKSHLLVHSTKRFKLSCQVCGRQYASSKSLKLHLRIHTQEKPFSCKNCSRQFRTSGHLIQHSKSHHKNKL